MPDLKKLQAELDDEVRNIAVMGLAPGLSPEKAAVIRDLERSARAEAKLRVMGLEYAKSQTASPHDR